MRPIREIAEVQPDAVVYHSAFGFARVTGVGHGGVRVEWESKDDNLPDRVSADQLLRVYALCAEDGFFYRSIHRREDLLELLHVDPPGALHLLLSDLPGPQQKGDVRDWVLGRGLMTEATFDRWWELLHGQIAIDDRFRLESEGLAVVRSDEPEGPLVRLQSPGLPPARRLDVVLAHRGSLDDDVVLEHLLRAWTDGTSQVRDLALTAARTFATDDVLNGLVARSTETVDGLIHALRRSGWEPHQVGLETRQRLVRRVIDGCAQGGTLDPEGRLAAVIYRWSPADLVPALVPLIGTPDGQQLVKSTISTLPQRRGEELALDLLERVAENDATSLAAQWLGRTIVVRATEDSEAIAARIGDKWPHAAQWLRVAYEPDLYDAPWEDGVDGGEISESIPRPMSLVEQAPRTGATFLPLCLGVARALADWHTKGLLAHPSRAGTFVHPDGTVRIEPGRDVSAALGEPASPRSDLHAAAILLIESMLGRPWPKNVPASRVLPYLRGVVPDLPGCAIGLLDVALHPDPDRRPVDARDWLSIVQTAAVAERDRAEDPGVTPLEVGYDTHVGFGKLLLTQTNQDALFLSASGSLRLLAVCDGISTATAGSGDVASGITAQVVGNLWEQALPRLKDAPEADIVEFLDRALRVANQAVCEAALRFAGGRLDGQVPMGTTAVLVVSRGADIWLATLGDSRAYVVSRGLASLVTADQNQAGDRLRAWQAGIDGHWDPAGFALVGYVGHFNDWSRPEALPPAHARLRLLPGERLVISSDGLTDYLADNHPETARRLAETALKGTPMAAARELVRLANEAGGGDNCTVVVAAVAG